MEILIGCSGWYYKHWLGTFYPKDMAVDDWLPFYCQRFPAVEVNTTFYHWPKPDTVVRWADGTPEGFAFIVKGTRLVTHDMPMTDTGRELHGFLSLFRPMGDKARLYLWQFPPYHKLNAGTMARLRKLAEDLRREGAPSTFEFRDPSWLHPEVAGLLEDMGFGYVHADAPDFYRSMAIPRLNGTAYLRMHGMNGNWSYGRDQMGAIVRRVMYEYGSGRIRTLWAMFNNDPYGNAPRDALRLMSLLRGEGLDPAVGMGNGPPARAEQLGLGF